MLEILSNKKFALSKDGHTYEPDFKTGAKIGAAQWIMSVFAREEWVMDSPLIRIDAVETTNALGLQRHTSNRYSYNQIREGLSKIPEQLDSLFKTKREDWSFEQSKLAEAIDKVSTLDNLFAAYTPITPRTFGIHLKSSQPFEISSLKLNEFGLGVPLRFSRHWLAMHPRAERKHHQQSGTPLAQHFSKRSRTKRPESNPKPNRY